MGPWIDNIYPTLVLLSWVAGAFIGVVALALILSAPVIIPVAKGRWFDALINIAVVLLAPLIGWCAGMVVVPVILLNTAQLLDLNWVHTQLSLTTEYARLIYVCLTSRFDPHGRAYLPAMRVWQGLQTLTLEPPPEKGRSPVLAAYGSSQRGRFGATVGEAKEKAREIIKLDRDANLELDRAMLALMKQVAAKILDVDDADDRPWTPSRWNDAVVAVVHEIHSQPNLFPAA